MLKQHAVPGRAGAGRPNGTAAGHEGGQRPAWSCHSSEVQGTRRRPRRHAIGQSLDQAKAMDASVLLLQPMFWLWLGVWLEPRAAMGCYLTGVICPASVVGVLTRGFIRAQAVCEVG